MWVLPDPGILPAVERESVSVPSAALRRALRDIDVPAQIHRVIAGPRTIRFELVPDPTVRMRDFTRLNRLDDLAFALAAENVTVEAPIRGKQLVGLEIPNPEPRAVELSEVIALTRPPLHVGLGIQADGAAVGTNLARLPHLGIAGASGSGKSSLIHTILCGLLMKCTPDDLRLLLVDLKRVELGRYREVPHMLEPTITNAHDAMVALEMLGDEVERRFGVLDDAGVDDIEAYNRQVQPPDEWMPRVLCVVDELGDLMLQAHERVETAITRVGQLGRACGIHLILATQSPHAKILSGLVKANVPGRVALRVVSNVHSKVAIDQTGAEKLLGQGDALLQDGQSNGLVRFQSAYVDEGTLCAIVSHWTAQTTETDAEPVSAPEDAPAVAFAKSLRNKIKFTPTDTDATAFVGRIRA